MQIIPYNIRKPPIDINISRERPAFTTPKERPSKQGDLKMTPAAARKTKLGPETGYAPYALPKAIWAVFRMLGSHTNGMRSVSYVVLALGEAYDTSK